MTQPIGTVARRAGRERSAADVPLSAHCRSSRHTSRGASSAARSSNISRSCSSQYRCSGEACASPRAVRSRMGEGPSNSASISADNWTTVSAGSATPLPTFMDRRRAIAASSTRRRLLPIPAPPSTTTTVPVPERSWSRCWPKSVSSASRPRTTELERLSVARSRCGTPSGTFGEWGGITRTGSIVRSAEDVHLGRPGLTG